MAQVFTPATSIGKKILCIEDEVFIGELYVRALTKAGYEVTVEIDGKQGLDLAKTDAYDIILLDIMVPTITGLEVLKSLRNPAETPKLHGKIIITTNLDQREDIRAAIEKQADGYLVKAEITPRELVGIINTIR
jgi:DNA-binding response OmpR family regulator